MLSREEAERKAAEFNQRLGELLKSNPDITPESPEVMALVKEFRSQGLDIQIVRRDDIRKAAQSFMQMLSQMGMSMGQEDFNQGEPQSLEDNLDPCKYHKKGLDDTNRATEISQTDIDNLAIDLNTKSDEDIWKMFS